MVLVLTQLFHTLFPGRVRYLRRLILSTMGVTMGELAGVLLLGGPRVGELHIAWDFGLVAALQLMGNRLAR